MRTEFIRENDNKTLFTLWLFSPPTLRAVVEFLDETYYPTMYYIELVRNGNITCTVYLKKITYE